jgi:thioredoxin-like negative regulator of GroEL
VAQKRTFLWIVAILLAAVAVLVTYQVANADTTKLVYVYSDSCGYCTSFAPTFEKVVKEFPEWKVERLDIQKDDELAKAESLGATATPTVFVLRDGQVVDKLEGDVSEKVFRRFLQKQVAGPSS